jgi:hypothetical protein
MPPIYQEAATQPRRNNVESVKWQAQKVHGRDEVLRDIQKRAAAYGETVVHDVRAVMHDYEVDMYRLVISIGGRYGMDTAYAIMSDTVADKRLRWLEQVKTELDLSGTEVEKGFGLYRKYFKLTEDNFQILEKTEEKVVFRRKDFIDAIAYACDVLGLDIIEVNNKVYARTTNLMFQKIHLNLKNVVLEYHDGWYDEMIEKSSL